MSILSLDVLVLILADISQAKSVAAAGRLLSEL